MDSKSQVKLTGMYRIRREMDKSGSSGSYLHVHVWSESIYKYNLLIKDGCLSLSKFAIE